MTQRPATLLLLSLALLAPAAVPAAAQTQAGKKAKAFKLDSMPAPADPAPADAAPPAAPDAAPALPAPALSVDTGVTAATPIRAAYTLDTPIQVLVADPAARAVLDRDLPGISDDENIDKFKALSLRSFQPLTGGQLTDAMLATVAGDLARLAGGDAHAAAAAPVKLGNAKRAKDESR